MKKIYAVGAGSYSDYRIVAIFSTRVKANEFMQSVGGGAVEEFNLDPQTTDLLKRGYAVWNVHMLIDGKTEKVEKTDNDLYDIQDANESSHQLWKRSTAPAYRGKGIPDILTSRVWAKTAQAAVKIVNEQRTMMIASGKWKG